MTASPSPPPAEPTVPSVPSVPTGAGPAPAVPYGPPVTESGSTPGAGVTVDLSSRSVAGTAGKWAFRLLLPIVIRAIFRAIFR